MSTTAHPPRRALRISRIKALYAWSLHGSTAEGGSFLKRVLANQEKLDGEILAAAPKHHLDTFNKVDLAILREALYELFYTDTPPLVVVDEAIEVAKLYAGEEAPAFISGVLGGIVDRVRKEMQNDSQSE